MISIKRHKVSRRAIQTIYLHLAREKSRTVSWSLGTFRERGRSGLLSGCSQSSKLFLSVFLRAGASCIISFQVRLGMTKSCRFVCILWCGLWSAATYSVHCKSSICVCIFFFLVCRHQRKDWWVWGVTLSAYDGVVFPFMLPELYVTFIPSLLP